jgi:hypothetical protein
MNCGLTGALISAPLRVQRMSGATVGVNGLAVPAAVVRGPLLATGGFMGVLGGNPIQITLIGDIAMSGSRRIYSTGSLYLGGGSGANILDAPTYTNGNTFSVGGAAGGAASSNKLTKQVASIADNTATAVLTVTVPNGAHSGRLRITLTGSLGAGGAVGANEATGCVTYDFTIARVAGANAVVTASTAFGSATCGVAGADTITVTAAASAVSGAVGAANTFTVQVKIARGSGSSANHTCLVVAEIANANASGITIA